MLDDTVLPGRPRQPARGLAPSRSALIARQDAFDKGFSADDIKRRVARREWIVVRPGTYLQAAELPALRAEERHLLQIDAELPRASAGAVVSHRSAACEHGIDLLEVPGKTVSVTNPGGASGHRRSLLHTRIANIDGDEWVTVRGHRVTSVARTVADIARTRSFEEGVVAADSALHRGLVTPDELVVAVNRSPRRAGTRRARRVVMFADPGAESVGESRSRVLIAHACLPTPTVQFDVVNEAGTSIAVSDFGWEEFCTVAEFDGAEKYGRLLKPGERPGDKIFQEKVREDEIRDAGYQVVRWIWDDLSHPEDLARRIRHGLERGARAGVARRLG